MKTRFFFCLFFKVESARKCFEMRNEAQTNNDGCARASLVAVLVGRRQPHCEYIHCMAHSCLFNNIFRLRVPPGVTALDEILREN